MTGAVAYMVIDQMSKSPISECENSNWQLVAGIFIGVCIGLALFWIINRLLEE